MTLIKIKVRTILEFKKIFGQRQFEISLSNESTVADFIEEIVTGWGDELASKLLTADHSELLPHIMFMVNGQNIHFLNNLETVLHNGDEVTILPPVGGG